MICAIHQPNFMPWLPFFDKVASCDVFIILTHCQFEKGGFQNRFRIGSAWKTMSVEGGLDLLTHKKYMNPGSDWDRIVNSLPQYSEVFKKLDIHPDNNLVFTNVHIIQRIRTILNLKCGIVMDHATKAKSTMRLVELCKEVGATTYLSGIGAKAYLDESNFTDAGIKVEFQHTDNTRKISILEHIKNVT